MAEAFSTQQRKKEFDRLFKGKIVPFFATWGFARHTKTSKRVFKELANGLSVFIFFEFKSFGYGFYDINIVYFDTELGDVYNDNYLAIAQIKTPSIKGNNSEEMAASAENWLADMQSNVIPFIENHTTHRAILHSEHFYFSKGREQVCRELLKRKSKD